MWKEYLNIRMINHINQLALTDVKNLLESSPLAYRVLKSINSEDGTLVKLVGTLGKTKPSVSRVLHVLKHEGLIENKKNPQDGRSTIYTVPPDKKTTVRNLLAEVTLSQKKPKPSRAIPFAMLDLEKGVVEALKTEFKDWEITAEHKSIGYDVLLRSKLNPPFEVGLELRVGGDQFERNLLRFMGKMLATKKLPPLLIIAIFGRVPEKVMTLAEDRLRKLLESQGTTLKVFWLDRGPLVVDQTYILKELIEKMQDTISERIAAIETKKA